MRYREEDLRRGTADVVTSGAGDMYSPVGGKGQVEGGKAKGKDIGYGISDMGVRKAESGIRNSEKNLSELCASAVQLGFTAETQRRGGVAPAERGPTEFTIQNQKLGSEAESGRRHIVTGKHFVS